MITPSAPEQVMILSFCSPSTAPEISSCLRPTDRLFDSIWQLLLKSQEILQLKMFLCPPLQFFSFRLCRSSFPCMLHYNKTSLSCCFCIFCYGFSRRILCCQLLQKSHSCSLPKGFLTLLSDNWICPWQSVKGLCQATSPITWGLFSSDSNNEGLHLLKMQLEFLWNK